MIEFGNAALLVGMTFGLVEVIKRLTKDLFDGKGLPDWAVGLVAMVVAIVVTFSVRASDFANEQVIGGKSLDALNDASVALVGLALGTLAIVGAEVLRAFRNIGANQD